MSKTRWIRGLDSLRFFLALIVMLSHLPDPFVNVLKHSGLIGHVAGVVLNHSFNGVAAVIAFFLISGFVIHYPNVGKDKIVVLPFLIRRWLRLGIPVLVLTIIARICHLPNRIPLWSLYCELIYYTIYPFLLMMKGTWRIKFYCSFIISVVAIVLLNRENIQSLITQTNINFHGTYAFHGTSTTWIAGLPCWLLGVLLAEKIETITNEVSPINIFLWRGVVLSGSMVCLALQAHLFVSYAVSLNFFAFLLYPWLKREIIYYRHHKPFAVFEYFGRFSYSLYIVHRISFVLIAFYLPLQASTYMAYIIISLIIAWLFYLLAEYPSHLFARKISKTITLG